MYDSLLGETIDNDIFLSKYIQPMWSSQEICSKCYYTYCSPNDFPTICNENKMKTSIDPPERETERERDRERDKEREREGEKNREREG